RLLHQPGVHLARRPEGKVLGGRPGLPGQPAGEAGRQLLVLRPYRRRKLAAGVRIRRQRQRPGACGGQAPGKVTIQENETMLTSKQRAYLRSLAVNEDTILMMGKSGMSPELAKQADDALEKRELIKGRVLPESSPMTSREAAEELARQTNSEVVQVIG